MVLLPRLQALRAAVLLTALWPWGPARSENHRDAEMPERQMLWSSCLRPGGRGGVAEQTALPETQEASVLCHCDQTHFHMVHVWCPVRSQILRWKRVPGEIFKASPVAKGGAESKRAGNQDKWGLPGICRGAFLPRVPPRSLVWVSSGSRGADAAGLGSWGVEGLSTEQSATSRTPLRVQGLRIRLPVPGICVWSLVRELRFHKPQAMRQPLSPSVATREKSAHRNQEPVARPVAKDLACHS